MVDLSTEHEMSNTQQVHQSMAEAQAIAAACTRLILTVPSRACKKYFYLSPTFSEMGPNLFFLSQNRTKIFFRLKKVKQQQTKNETRRQKFALECFCTNCFWCEVNQSDSQKLQKALNECGSWWERGLMCRSNCRSWQFRVPASWRNQLEGDLWYLDRRFYFALGSRKFMGGEIATYSSYLTHLKLAIRVLYIGILLNQTKNLLNRVWCRHTSLIISHTPRFGCYYSAEICIHYNQVRYITPGPNIMNCLS